MKKVFKSSMMLAVLATAFMFPSCTKDTTNDITISLDNNSTFASGAAVTGTITSTTDLTSVTILTVNGTNQDTYYIISDFKASSQIVQSGTTYTVRLTGKPGVDTNLPDGTYQLTATDKNANISSRTFTVGSGSVTPGNTPLSAVQSFGLGRPDQAAAGYPASSNGITWSTNPTTTTARFTGSFVMLTSTEYSAITTQEALATAYTAGTTSASFDLTASPNFTAKYFIVKDGTTYRLVKATSCTFSYDAGTGIASNKANFDEQH